MYIYTHRCSPIFLPSERHILHMSTSQEVYKHHNPSTYTCTSYINQRYNHRERLRSYPILCHATLCHFHNPRYTHLLCFYSYLLRLRMNEGKGLDRWTASQSTSTPHRHLLKRNEKKERILCLTMVSLPHNLPRVQFVLSKIIKQAKPREKRYPRN